MNVTEIGWLSVGVLLGFLTAFAVLSYPPQLTSSARCEEGPGAGAEDEVMDVDFEKVVARGQVQSKSVRDGSGGRAEAVMFVRCDPDRVRRILADFDAYPEMVADVTGIDVYERSAEQVAVNIRFRILFVNLQNALVHKIGDSSITWELDARNGESALFAVNSGCWSWRPHDDGTLLFYQARIVPRFWVPDRLLDKVCSYGSETAVGWVRQVAETSERHVTYVASCESNEIPRWMCCLRPSGT